MRLESPTTLALRLMGMAESPMEAAIAARNIARVYEDTRSGKDFEDEIRRGFLPENASQRIAGAFQMVGLENKPLIFNVFKEATQIRLLEIAWKRFLRTKPSEREIKILAEVPYFKDRARALL